MFDNYVWEELKSEDAFIYALQDPLKENHKAITLINVQKKINTWLIHTVACSEIFFDKCREEQALLNIKGLTLEEAQQESLSLLRKYVGA